MTTLHEAPLFLDGPAGPLFVVETTSSASRAGSVVVNGGGWLGTGTNRNAVLVRMARRLAENGYRATRFDWRGTGESGGTLESFDLKGPFGDDVGTVIEHLEGTGSDAIALTGICFGSVSAVAAAREHESVKRLALISLPFPSRMTKADHKADRIDLDAAMKMALKPATWATLVKNSAMRQAVIRALKRKLFGRSTRGKTIPSKTSGLDTALLVEELAGRGVDIHLIFGEGDLEYASYQAYVEHTPLPPSVKVQVVPGDLSNFGTILAQEAAIEHVVAALTPPWGVLQKTHGRPGG